MAVRRGGKSEPENSRPPRQRCALVSGEKPPLPLTQRRSSCASIWSPLSRCSTVPDHLSFLCLLTVPLAFFPFFFFPCERSILKPYLVSPVSPRLLQPTVSAHLSLGPSRRRNTCDRSRAGALWSPAARAPAPSALSLGFRPELLGRDLTPRFPGPPANTLGCRGREAAWDMEAPGPFGDRGTAFRAGVMRRTRGAPAGLTGARRAGGASSGLTVLLNWVKAKLNTEALCAN